MAEIERMIFEARDWRREHFANRRMIEAAACAIREKALCDAREAIAGRAEAPFLFRPINT